MTAVLSPIDVLKRNVMTLDSDREYSPSPVDWRAKYDEVADMLAETRTELDDFHVASKELEAELENELQRTEKAQQDLKIKVAKAEMDRDDWKTKFMTLQTTHNTTTTSLQRELDQLRQQHQRLKVQLRDLEMGNDDLERTERAVSSSLADAEAKYSRTLEEKILLEHELLDKANLEEQCQRLKDELRDANIEVSILKDQLSAAHKAISTLPTSSTANLPHISSLSEDDLLHTAPPADLQLSELDPSTDSLTDSMPGDFCGRTPESFTESLPSEEDETPRKAPPPRLPSAPKTIKANMQTPPTSISTGIPRSYTSPSMYGSPRTPSTRTPVARNASTMSTSTVSSTASKSRGVQMVTEMRARVRNLEQKIHTRVPRLRMGSSASRPIGSPLLSSTITNRATPPAANGKFILGKSSWENPITARRSVESQRSDKSKKESGSDSSGWVLIMEDSPSPPRNRDRELRRTSSPLGASTYRSVASSSSPTRAPQYSSSSPPQYSSPSPTRSTPHTSLYQSSMRRPQSRLSAGSSNTTSSIPTSASRPSTPTFLPIPSSGMSNMKRSTGPATSATIKRSSLASSTAAMPPPSSTFFSTSRYSSDTSTGHSKALPRLPDLKNITMRTGKFPSSSTSTSLSQSRIGRPSGGQARRKSSEETTTLSISDLKKELRPRAGSTANYGKT